MFSKIQNSFKSTCYVLPHLGKENPLNKGVISHLSNLKSYALASSATSSSTERLTPFRNQTYLHLFLSNTASKGWFFSTSTYSLWGSFQNYSVYFLEIYRKTLGDGFLYIRGLFVIFFVDACLTDDEPLWEPVE